MWKCPGSQKEPEEAGGGALLRGTDRLGKENEAGIIGEGQKAPEGKRVALRGERR